MNNKRTWKLYLSGEIHTNWRNEIQSLCTQNELQVIINSPNTKHSESDDCGATILGGENNKFWHDRKGAAINSIRNTVLIKETDILIVKFGDQYRQWNAAFDTGVAAAEGKAIITFVCPLIFCFHTYLQNQPDSALKVGTLLLLLS